MVVHDLKEAGLAASDAWEIWQQRFEYVDASKRPQGIEFETYIREKLHLLKQRQAAGKVKSATGFLLRAIKQNYANPEFAEEEKKRQASEKAKIKHLTERSRQLLEGQRGELQTARDTAMHQLCEKIVTETPAILEEVATDIFKANPLVRKTCQHGKTLLDNYQEKPMLRALVDQCLMERYSERFRTIRERYDFELTALEPNPGAEDRASA
jgi:hypothetical protein